MSVSGSTEAKGIRGDGGIVTESSERLTITTAAGQQQREKGTKIFCRKERRPTRLGTSAIHKTRIDGDYTESGSAVLFPQNCNVDWFSYNVAEGPVCLRVCLCWTREKLARLAGWNHEPARWIIFVQYNEKEREGGTRIIRFGISRIVFSFNQKPAALASSGSTGRTCLLFLFLPSYCIWRLKTRVGAKGRTHRAKRNWFRRRTTNFGVRLFECIWTMRTDWFWIWSRQLAIDVEWGGIVVYNVTGYRQQILSTPQSDWSK